jgi:hypothetical protein
MSMLIALGITIAAIVAATLIAFAVAGAAALASSDFRDPYE